MYNPHIQTDYLALVNSSYHIIYLICTPNGYLAGTGISPKLKFKVRIRLDRKVHKKVIKYIYERVTLI